MEISIHIKKKQKIEKDGKDEDEYQIDIKTNEDYAVKLPVTVKVDIHDVKQEPQVIVPKNVQMKMDSWIAIGDYDGNVHLFDAVTGTKTRMFPVIPALQTRLHDGSPVIKLSPTKTSFAYGVDVGVACFDMESGKVITSDNSVRKCTSIAFKKDSDDFYVNDIETPNFKSIRAVARGAFPYTAGWMLGRNQTFRKFSTDGTQFVIHNSLFGNDNTILYGKLADINNCETLTREQLWKSLAGIPDKPQYWEITAIAIKGKLIACAIKIHSLKHQIVVFDPQVVRNGGALMCHEIMTNEATDIELYDTVSGWIVLVTTSIRIFVFITKCEGKPFYTKIMTIPNTVVIRDYIFAHITDNDRLVLCARDGTIVIKDIRFDMETIKVISTHIKTSSFAVSNKLLV